MKNKFILPSVTKVLHKEIDQCIECPYCDSDSHTDLVYCLAIATQISTELGEPEAQFGVTALACVEQGIRLRPLKDCPLPNKE